LNYSSIEFPEGIMGRNFVNPSGSSSSLPKVPQKKTSPPAWITRLEALRHRENLIPCKCSGIFVREYPSQKFRYGFMEPYIEKEEKRGYSSPSMYSFKKPWRLFSPHVFMWKN
jgi:hypothetical protein